MKQLLCIVTLVAVSLTLNAQCLQKENVYAFKIGDKDYAVVKEKKNWTEAAACAVENGGYLVEIENLTEQKAIYNAIIEGAEVSPTYTTIATGGGIAYVWIGATDQNDEGTWLWDGDNDNEGIEFWAGQGSNGDGDGAAVENRYSNWGGSGSGTPNEPDNYAGQHSAAIGLGNWPAGVEVGLGVKSEWNDINGSSQLYYVIEEYDESKVSSNNRLSSDLLNVYPNPVSDLLQINVGSLLITEYRLLSTDGRVLFESLAGSSVVQLDFSEYLAGMYFVSVETNEGNITQKVLKK